MDKEYLLKLLSEFSLVIIRDNGIIFCSRDPTIRPILEAYYRLRDNLNGSIVADRVVGKAVALILCNYRPRLVFGGIMSNGAKNILEKYGVDHDYDVLVEYIRTKDGDICPFERLVENIFSPEEAVEIIRKKLGI